MNTRWIFTQDGKPAFYNDGGNIYSPKGARVYWVSDTWWFRQGDAYPEYYESDGWVFTRQGRPAFYYEKK